MQLKRDLRYELLEKYLVIYTGYMLKFKIKPKNAIVDTLVYFYYLHNNVMFENFNLLFLLN